MTDDEIDDGEPLDALSELTLQCCDMIDELIQKIISEYAGDGSPLDKRIFIKCIIKALVIQTGAMHAATLLSAKGEEVDPKIVIDAIIEALNSFNKDDPDA